jgi:hypothetical protein
MFCSQTTGWVVEDRDLDDAVYVDRLFELGRRVGPCAETEGDCVQLTGTARLQIEDDSAGPYGYARQVLVDVRIPTIEWEVPCGGRPGAFLELGVGDFDTCEVAERCAGGDDEDGDGVVDCADPDCSGSAACTPE